MEQGIVPQPGLKRLSLPRPASAYHLSKGGITAMGRPGPPPHQLELVGSTGVRTLQCRGRGDQPAAVVVSQRQMLDVAQAAKQVVEESNLSKARTTAAAAAEQRQQQQERKTRWQRRSHSAPPSRKEEHDDVQLQQRLQQREEVRQLQRQVLALKCTAIREAQLHEKEYNRRSEKAEEARVEETVEWHRRKALQEDEKKKQMTQKARQVASRSLQLQIEARTLQKRQKTQEKQNEAMLAKRRDERLKDEQDEDVRRRVASRQRQLQDFRRQADDVKARVKKETIMDAIEEEKAARVAAEKLEAAEKAAVEAAEMRKLRDDLKTLQVQRAEQQQKYRAMKQQLIFDKEHEEVERSWRARLLQEARAKQAREEAVLQEREKQVRLLHEKKRQEAEREKREGEVYSKIYVMPGADLRPTAQQKQQMASDLKAQAREAEAIKSAEVARAAAERLKAQQLQRHEENALRTLQADTIAHLRDIGIPGRLVKELERQVMKTRPPPAPRPPATLGPII
ncbi:hypothetical protein FHG87_012342 [Trinorchestia longiramus]|nr:hypothetical protein FHG87_012342 [Trinorchestia longiramus]